MNSQRPHRVPLALFSIALCLVLLPVVLAARPARAAFSLRDAGGGAPLASTTFVDIAATASGDCFVASVTGRTVWVERLDARGRATRRWKWDTSEVIVAALVFDVPPAARSADDDEARIVVVSAAGSVAVGACRDAPLIDPRGSYASPVQPYHAKKVGGSGVLLAGATGIDAVSISDPDHPVSLGWSPTPVYDADSDGTLVYTVDGTYVSAVGPGSFVQVPAAGCGEVYAAEACIAVRCSERVELRSRVTLDLLTTIPAPAAVTCAVSGDRVAVAQAEAGVRLYDTTDPANPVEIGAFSKLGEPPFWLTSLALSERNFVYSVGRFTGGRTADGADWTRMGDQAYGMIVADRWRLIADKGAGIAAVPDRGPASFDPATPPYFLDGFETSDLDVWPGPIPGSPGAIRAGRRIPSPPIHRPASYPIAVAATNTGLAVVGVDGGRLATGGTWSGGPATRVATTRAANGMPIALLLDATGLRILALSDPAFPSLLATVPLSYADDVVLEGTRATVSLRFAPARILDVSDPVHPVDLGPAVAGAEWKCVEGNRLYGAGNFRLLISDITDPVAPLLLGTHLLQSGDAIQAVAIGHRADGALWAWLAVGDNGVVIVDVTDPAATFEVARYDTGGFARGVLLDGRFAWIADGPGGVRRFEVVDDGPAPARGALAGAAAPASTAAAAPGRDALSVFPNPARGASTISFTLPHSAAATVSVFDVAGRRLARLADGTYAAGRNDVVWNGRDEAGRRVAAGVYLVRLETGGRPETRRVVRLD